MTSQTSVNGSESGPVSIMRKQASTRRGVRVHFDLSTAEPQAVPVKNTFIHVEEEDDRSPLHYTRMQSEPLKVCRDFSLASDATTEDISEVSTDASDEDTAAPTVKNTFIHLNMGPQLSMASTVNGQRRERRIQTEPLKVQLSAMLTGLSPRSRCGSLDMDLDMPLRQRQVSGSSDGSDPLDLSRQPSLCRLVTDDGFDFMPGLQGPALEQSSPWKVCLPVAERESMESGSSPAPDNLGDISPCSPPPGICALPTGDFFEARMTPPLSLAEAAPLALPPGVFVQQPLVPRGMLAQLPTLLPASEQSLGSSTLVGRVWSKSQEAAGCREVQQALDAASSDAEHASLVRELQGRVWEAMRCSGAKHANHVLQKCIVTMRGNDCQFILEEVVAIGVTTVATQKFGCRVIQRMLEHFPSPQLRELVDMLLSNAGEVCRDMYGNYVMQCLLEHGTAAQCKRLMEFIEKDVRALCSDKFGSAVVSASLHNGTHSERLAIARAILREAAGFMTLIACSQHGHGAVKRILQLLQGEELEEARRRLGAEAAALNASNYGRIVVNFLKLEAPECLVLPEQAEAKRTDERQLATSGEAVVGRVWPLSQDPTGCRDVQQALRDAQSQTERKSIMAELGGHVWEALRCPHANHVLQECITSAQRLDFQFIIDELMMGDVVQAAEHRYGCRVLQRLLEHAAPEQLQGLVGALMAGGSSLSRHVYGNYVMQCLLEHSTEQQREALVQLVVANLGALSLDPQGGAVVGAALAGSAPADQERLARALLRESGLLPQMACLRHGHVAVSRALAVLPARERQLAVRELRAAQGLSASRYGRVILAQLNAEQ